MFRTTLMNSVRFHPADMGSTVSTTETEGPNQPGIGHNQPPDDIAKISSKVPEVKPLANVKDSAEALVNVKLAVLDLLSASQTYERRTTIKMAMAVYDYLATYAAGNKFQRLPSEKDTMKTLKDSIGDAWPKDSRSKIQSFENAVKRGMRISNLMIWCGAEPYDQQHDTSFRLAYVYDHRDGPGGVILASLTGGVLKDEKDGTLFAKLLRGKPTSQGEDLKAGDLVPAYQTVVFNAAKVWPNTKTQMGTTEVPQATLGEYDIRLDDKSIFKMPMVYPVTEGAANDAYSFYILGNADPAKRDQYGKPIREAKAPDGAKATGEDRAIHDFPARDIVLAFRAFLADAERCKAYAKEVGTEEASDKLSDIQAMIDAMVGPDGEVEWTAGQDTLGQVIAEEQAKAAQEAKDAAAQAKAEHDAIVAAGDAGKSTAFGANPAPEAELLKTGTGELKPAGKAERLAAKRTGS